MPLIYRQCRWSERALAARRLFTTPEVTELTRTIRVKIKDFFRQGEGFQTTIIPVLLFACEFVLVYSFEEEIWVFDVVMIPPTGPKGPGPSKRGRRRKGYERAIVKLFDDFAPIWEDWSGAAVALWYNIARLLGPRIAEFCADVQCRQRAFGELKSIITAMLRRFAPAATRAGPAVDPSSQVCGEVVRLVRRPVQGLLTWLGLIWAWERPLGRPSQAILWDIAWFGPPAKASM